MKWSKQQPSMVFYPSVQVHKDCCCQMNHQKKKVFIILTIFIKNIIYFKKRQGDSHKLAHCPGTYTPREKTGEHGCWVSSTWDFTLCPSGCALAGRWYWEQSWGSRSGTTLWDAGFPKCILTAMPSLCSQTFNQGFWPTPAFLTELQGGLHETECISAWHMGTRSIKVPLFKSHFKDCKAGGQKGEREKERIFHWFTLQMTSHHWSKLKPGAWSPTGSFICIIVAQELDSTSDAFLPGYIR